MKRLFAVVCFLLAVGAVPSQSATIDFNGALDLTYYDWGKDGTGAGKSTFDVYEFYFLGNAEIADNVRGYFETRYEHVNEEVSLRQGFIDWNIAKPVNLSVGLFYLPIGTYNRTYYPSTRKFATYVYAMRMINITPMQDVGAMVHGDVPVSDMKLTYALAMSNGQDQDYIASSKPRDARQTRDVNDSKEISGRLGFFPIPELEVGVSGATSKYDNNDNKNLVFADVDLALNIRDLEVRGEYVESKADDLTTTKEIKSSGYYVHAAYKVIKNRYGINFLEPAVRYDEITAGRTMKDIFTINPATNGKVSRVTAGLNVSPQPHFIIKAEYGWTTEEKASLDNDAFYLQFCVDF